MRRERLFWIGVVSTVMLALLLCGCGSSRPAKFYTLTPVQSMSTPGKQTAVSGQKTTVGVGPLEIPDYVDRPQIVTRTAQNELDVAQFDRWGGSLKPDVARVLMEHLSTLLSPDQISVAQWTRSGSFQYRVALDITRFDVTPGQNVWLKAQWTIFGRDGKAVLARESNITEPVAGRDYTTMVSAMSRALGSLSRDVADNLRSVL